MPPMLPPGVRTGMPGLGCAQSVTSWNAATHWTCVSFFSEGETHLSSTSTPTTTKSKRLSETVAERMKCANSFYPVVSKIPNG